jgi:hypothetical protein
MDCWHRPHVVRWRKELSNRWLNSPEALKVKKTFRHFEQWAQKRGLKPVTVPYVRVTPSGEMPLQVMPGGDPALEQFFRTHYIPGDLPPTKSKRIATKLAKPKTSCISDGETFCNLLADATDYQGRFLFMGKSPAYLFAQNRSPEFLDGVWLTVGLQHSRLSAVIIHSPERAGVTAPGILKYRKHSMKPGAST